ncbi:HCP-like protein, partial [Backusella circina FSU 941]
MNEESVAQNLYLDPNTITDEEIEQPFAQLELGKAYYFATHIENNYHRAFEWLSLSAKQGNMEAQFRIADMYALGHGVDQNLFLAHEWYRKSALQNYPNALIRIQNLYEEDNRLHSRGEINSEEEGMNEKEFKKDHNVRELNEYRLMHSEKVLGNTIEYFSNRFNALKESKTMDEDTYHELGFHYQHGYGVRKISKRAMECYTSAAEQGHPSAQYNLGFLYQHNTKIKFNYTHAFKWYTLASKGGSSEAQNCLGYLYEKGLGVDIDLLRALYWYTQAAESNNKGASLNIARMHRKGLFNNVNYSESIKWYITAAEQGGQVSKNCLYLLTQTMDINGIFPSLDEKLYSTESLVRDRMCSRLRHDILNVEKSTVIYRLKQLAKHALIGDGNAMLEIGFKYMTGTELTQDKDIGLKWIKNAARSGLTKAQLVLGELYEHGEHGAVKQNYYKAGVWYALATKKKNAVAQYKLGLLYFNGHGVRKDPLEASKWFTWSADQGNSDAQYLLGVLRFLGVGLSKDICEAFEWFTKSASQKNTQALYHLGKIYWTGIIFKNEIYVQKDEKRAFTMYKYAASHGNLNAQILLGRMYEKGDYVEKDIVKSIEYYSLAADLGDLESKYKLGCMYLNGVNVEHDYIKAYKLIHDAAKNGYYKAKCFFDTPTIYSESIHDYSNVLTMFEKAVEYKMDDLEYNIGYLYENGLQDCNGYQILNFNFSLALDWYLRAEKKNDKRAIYRLGEMYKYGKGINHNMWAAHTYYTVGSNLRNSDSMFALANMYLEGIDVTQDMPKAFYLFFNAANMGHQESRLLLPPLFDFNENEKYRCIYLSVMEMLEKVAEDGNIVVQDKLGDYYRSLGDLENAIGWYEVAAECKITGAYYNLGKIYTEEGFYYNPSKAIELYELATEKQHTESIYEMARMYHYGIGIPQDYLKAYQLYTDAANGGHRKSFAILNITSDSNNTTSNNVIEDLPSPLSEDFNHLLSMYEFVAADGHTELQYKIGYVYEKIIKTPEYEKAIKWYLMAASGCHKEAAYRLGLLYKNGLGAHQNWSKAIQFFERAMNNGSYSACFELGLINHHGSGVEMNKTKALEYYRKAADHHDSNGEFMMGKLYEDGQIVQKDLLEAIRWYKKAYDQRNGDAITRLYDLQNDKLDEVSFDRRVFHILQNFASHHEGHCEDGDPDFYGYMYFRLGYIYLDGILVETNYEKAWYYFHISLKGYNNRDALYYITIAKQHLQGSEMFVQNKKLEMFDAVIDKLDKELLYEIAVGYYDQTCSTNCDIPHAVNTNYATLFKYFTKAFEKGYSKASKYLGDMCYHGEGVEIDHKNALLFYRKWAEHQSAQENFQTGCEYYGLISNKRRNDFAASVYFEKAASHNIEKARMYLADMYYFGQGVEKNQEEAIKMYMYSAFKQSHWENLLTGIRYYRGDKAVSINYTIALVYFRISKKQGNSEVLRYLGEIYYYGRGTEIDKDRGLGFYMSLSTRQDHAENTTTGQEYLTDNDVFQRNESIAFLFFNAASNGGNVLIRKRLGDMYYYGNGVQRNKSRGLALHESFSGQCDCLKNKVTGLQYYHGNADTKKSYSIAFIYIKKATEQGNIKAQLYLGDMYYYGRGVKYNRLKAIELYKSSSEQQGSRANIATGIQYYNGGDGVIKNRETAFIFFDRVALQENTNDIRQLADLLNSTKDNDIGDVEKAKIYYEKSAYQQSIITNNHIASQYYNGINGTKEDALVSHIFSNMATKQEKIKRQSNLADKLYFGERDFMDRAKALELYRECANQQNNKMNLSVGLKYYICGYDTEESNAIAFIYISQAARQGNMEANRHLGDMYYFGQGITKDKDKAIELYNLVSSQQGITGNITTGLQYCNDGRSINTSCKIALLFLNKLSYKKTYNSQRYLAEELYHGMRVAQNQEMAIQLFKASADELVSEINMSIGNRYYFGKNGDGKDLSIAFIYISKSADQGNGDARLRLGHMYYFGIGTNKDQAKAIRLFKASANQFNGLKNTRIGLEYYEGYEEKEANLLIAFIYLLKAADQGVPTAQEYVSNI